MTWSYHIHGIAEAPIDTTQHQFVVKARETLDIFYMLSLVGFNSAELGSGAKMSDHLEAKLEIPE